jgi:hypothetical protein
LTDLINKLAGPLAEEVGLTLGQKAYEYRVRNAIKILGRVEQMLSEAGIEPARIPPRFLLPALEAASVEDDATLQGKWAALLANAADPNQSANRPSFVEVLKQLTPEEVAFLDSLAASKQLLIADRAHDLGTFEGLALAFVGQNRDEWAHVLRDSGHYRSILDDLMRLGILDRQDPAASIESAVQKALSARSENQLRSNVKSGLFQIRNRRYFLTPFGSAFLLACTAPVDHPAEDQQGEN